MTNETILDSVRATVERAWCQHNTIDSDGNVVEPWDSSAVAWDLHGALEFFCYVFHVHSSQQDEVSNLLDKATTVRFPDVKTYCQLENDPRAKLGDILVIIDIAKKL